MSKNWNLEKGRQGVECNCNRRGEVGRWDSGVWKAVRRDRERKVTMEGEEEIEKIIRIS